MSTFLSEAHRHMLEAGSSITPSMIEARGYFTALLPEEIAALGFSPDQCIVPALVVPLWGPDNEIVGYQTRPDAPRLNDSGKPIKYETPAGWHMRIDISPASRADIDDPMVPLIVTEGCKKSDSAAVRGLCAIALIGVWNWRGTNSKGGVTELADWDRIAIKNRRIYIVFDSDVMVKPQVKDALRRLAAMLRRRGAKEVLPVVLHQDGKEKIGLDDFFAGGGTVSEMRGCTDPDILAATQVITNNRGLADVAADTMAAMVAANIPPTLFVRDSQLVRVETSEQGMVRIAHESHASLRGRAARCAAFIKKGKESNSEIYPPKDVIEDVITWGVWPDIPPIIGVTTAPLLTASGTISRLPGYCPDSCYYISSTHLWPVWQGTTKEAVDYIEGEILGDFPFETQSDRANAIAVMLLLICRPAIRGQTPLHLIEAPSQGTGKSLLARVLLMSVLGSEIAATPGTRDEEEWRKKIAAGLLEGRAYIFFDNIEHKLDSAALAGVLTTGLWVDRILGQSRNINVLVKCAWLATGNNVTLSRDILRRTVRIRLNAGVERPQDRSGFKHADIEAYVITHRVTIVSALLAIIQPWLDAGRPATTKRIMGSYESYTNVIGGILDCAGVKGFLDNADDFRAMGDGEELAWAEFYQRWWNHFGAINVKGGELLAEFNLDEDLSVLVGDKGELSQKQRLGKLIHSRIGVVAGGFRIAQGSFRAGSNVYRLEPVTPHNPPSNPPNSVGSNGGFENTELDSNGGLWGVFSEPSAHTRTHTREGAEKNPQTPHLNPDEPKKPPNETPQNTDDLDDLEIL